MYLDEMEETVSMSKGWWNRRVEVWKNEKYEKEVKEHKSDGEAHWKKIHEGGGSIFRVDGESEFDRAKEEARDVMRGA